MWYLNEWFWLRYDYVMNNPNGVALAVLNETVLIAKKVC
ncbi:hypothetical protein C942_04616 [Photobacterium marinum]|uniref:Uncharacterized protein n=1 Tax=Photobacterium marinum TaxID=1056511 RepID=L8JHJ0_9GAMM|nr:hypothetical protein C942_04616 [Photobacterium marinum]